MKYMLLIYLEENALSEPEREACFADSTQLAHDLEASGHFLAAAPLEPTSRAATIRIRDGKQMVTDGPFAELREQLGGYFLVEARDAEEAIQIAARIPVARFGTVEVRPVMERADLPASYQRQAVLQAGKS